VDHGQKQPATKDVRMRIETIIILIIHYIGVSEGEQLPPRPAPYSMYFEALLCTQLCFHIIVASHSSDLRLIELIFPCKRTWSSLEDRSRMGNCKAINRYNDHTIKDRQQTLHQGPSKRNTHTPSSPMNNPSSWINGPLYPSLNSSIDTRTGSKSAESPIPKRSRTL